MNKELREILEDLKTAENGDYTLMEYERKHILAYINQLQKKAELGEHYKHLYSEVKKQKDELEKENNELQKAYMLIDKSMYELMKQKDDVVELIKARIKENEGHINARMEIYHYKNMLRMLGEIDE